ncbi:hypothetical protein Tco_0037822, partial [Tanacetum coccineum]
MPLARLQNTTSRALVRIKLLSEQDSGSIFSRGIVHRGTVNPLKKVLTANKKIEDLDTEFAQFYTETNDRFAAMQQEIKKIQEETTKRFDDVMKVLAALTAKIEPENEKKNTGPQYADVGLLINTQNLNGSFDPNKKGWRVLCFGIKTSTSLKVKMLMDGYIVWKDIVTSNKSKRSVEGCGFVYRRLACQLVGVPEPVLEGTFINRLKPELRAYVRVMQPEGLHHAVKMSIPIDENKTCHRCPSQTLHVLLVDESDGSDEEAAPEVLLLGNYGISVNNMVKNLDNLVGNLNTIWIGKFRLRFNIARFQRGAKSEGVTDKRQTQYAKVNIPNTNTFSRSFTAAISNDLLSKQVVKDMEAKVVMVINEECLTDKKFDLTLVAKLKTFETMPNLCVICNDEGFENITIRVEERVMWVDVEGTPSVAWTHKTFAKIASKVSVIRAREIIGWNPDFIKDDNESNIDCEESEEYVS